MKPLVALQRLGQSIWYDNIHRRLITSGELQRMVVEDGLRGVTSNPTIFEKALAGSDDYDAAIGALVARGLDDPVQIYEALAIEDIRGAADILRPVYEQSHGLDGYVSLEVSPKLAHDTERSVAEARRCFAQVGRPNVMIKIPATPAGMPAIERSIAAGINVNVTLIFAIAMYEKVAEAYLAGLERFLEAGGRPPFPQSVASFFVSRLDTRIDQMLDEKIAAANDAREQERLRALQGQAAIANTKRAYQKFKEIFATPRFAALRRRGARVQRPLWASTSTKNLRYPDLLYVEGLIGADTVNTVPPETYRALLDHGVVRATVEENLDGARVVLRELERVGINLDEVTRQLLEAGVEAFDASFDKLLEVIAAKRDRVCGIKGDVSRGYKGIQGDIGGEM